MPTTTLPSASLPAPGRRMSLTVTALLVLALCAAIGTALFLHTQAQRFNQLVAVSWGQPDPNGAPALFGAYVWLDGAKPAQRVMLSIYVDRPSFLASYRFDDRELGRVADDVDAVARWGELRWSPAGLHIGQGPHALLIPAAELAQHR